MIIISDHTLIKTTKLQNKYRSSLGYVKSLAHAVEI